MTVAAAPVLRPPLEQGVQLAPGLTVIEHLSRNQALDVYDVWDEGRYCRCVAKALRPDRREDARALRRLRREGRLLARCTHPHLVRAYETLSDPHTIVLLETLNGETLDHLIARSTRRMPIDEVALLGLHLGSAVRYLHRAGYLHLDLKPSNVIVDGGLAKLLDLSLARAPGRVRRGIGTRWYLSPEQARGGLVTAAADVWGLGVTLFEATAGSRPFAERDDVRYAQLVERAPRLDSSRRRVPRQLGAVIDASLEPDAAARPTVDEVLAALETVA